MTLKLYDSKPYEDTFSAEALSCREAERPGGALYAVTLDQTLFFPEEGGQTPDTGVLTPCGQDADSISVLDVQIKGDEIIHFCDRPIEPGTAVTGTIDWTHRFDNMQQHTGEHIISGLVNQYYGYKNVGFHLSDDTVTMDYDRELSPEQIDRIELLANQAIWDNRAVTAWYPAPDELANLDYRSKIDLTEGVRLVKIDGVDLCACCAPHVSSTAQVGLLKIVDYRRYKGGMRLWIKCGARALADYKMLHAQSAAISEAFSAPREALLEPVRKAKEEIDSLKSTLNQANASLLAAKLSGITDDQPDVVLFEAEMNDAKVLRDALNDLAAGRNGYCAVFFDRQTSDGASVWRYICASTGSDCRAWNESLKNAFPVRGGGQESMVQGSVTARQDELKSFFDMVSSSTNG